MKLDSLATSDSRMITNDNPTKSTTKGKRKKALFQITDETFETGLKKKLKTDNDSKENPK